MPRIIAADGLPVDGATRPMLLPTRGSTLSYFTRPEYQLDMRLMLAVPSILRFFCVVARAWTVVGALKLLRVPDQKILTIHHAIGIEIGLGPGRCGGELVAVPDEKILPVDHAVEVGVPAQIRIA